jgi:hypothetical protein
MVAVHHTLQLLTTTYRDEPTHIFTYYLNVLYLLNTQIKHPTLCNIHTNKIILESMIKTLQFHTQTSTFYKVKAHANINSSEQAYVLTKWGCKLDHRDAATPYEHTHPTS